MKNKGSNLGDFEEEREKLGLFSKEEGEKWHGISEMKEGIDIKGARACHVKVKRLY